MATFLYDIQAIIKDYLKTDPYFADVHIVTEDANELDAEINKALTENYMTGESKGICIAIQMMTGSVEHPNVPGVHLMPATAVFDVFENPAINRAAGGNGKKGLVVAEMLLAIMARFDNAEIPNAKFWHATNAIDRVDLPEWGFIVHRCMMHTQGGSVDTTEIVATPVITRPTEDEATITCATSGASIYYTINGTRPNYIAPSHAGNNGTLYTVPLTSLGAAVVMARGYKNGLRSSILGISNPP